MLLLQSYRAGCDKIRSPGYNGTYVDFVWFDPTLSKLCTTDTTRQSRKLPADSAFGNDPWGTVPPSFDTIAEPSPGTQAAYTGPYVGFSPDSGGNRVVNDPSLSSK